MRTFSIVAFAASALCASPFAHSAVASPISALTFTSFGSNGTAIDSTRGYAFDVTQVGLVAAALSFFDVGGDGLAESHDIGLWDPAGSLIASATVAAGVSAPLINGFRVVDIPDLALPIGLGYMVGAVFINGSADLQALNLVGITTAPGITYEGARIISNVATLTRPTGTLSFTGLPGGSLLVDSVDAGASTVPEPASLALLGTGLAVVGVGRRLRKRQ